MTIEEIIDGLQFTIDMFLFNPSTGEIQPKHLLNEDSRLTVDACEGAIDTMRKYQQLQADYEARLKADMVAMLEGIRFLAEENIENIYKKDEDNILMLAQHNAFADCFAQYNSLIEDKIDALKE